MSQLILSDAKLSPAYPIVATDEYGQTREVFVAGEQPLTIKVDDQEIVTLMTLGTYPEALTLGYLRNQQLVDSIDEITRVWVDWDNERVDVNTVNGNGIQLSACRVTPSPPVAVRARCSVAPWTRFMTAVWRVYASNSLACMPYSKASLSITRCIAVPALSTDAPCVMTPEF